MSRTIEDVLKEMNATSAKIEELESQLEQAKALCAALYEEFESF